MSLRLQGPWGRWVPGAKREEQEAVPSVGWRGKDLPMKECRRWRKGRGHLGRRRRAVCRGAGVFRNLLQGTSGSPRVSRAEDDLLEGHPASNWEEPHVDLRQS